LIRKQVYPTNVGLQTTLVIRFYTINTNKNTSVRPFGPILEFKTTLMAVCSNTAQSRSQTNDRFVMYTPALL